MTKGKVLVGGCFDVIHIGHIQFLKRAKSFGDCLIVLLESDENIKKLKGEGRPIHTFSERKAILESLKFVDKVIAVPKITNNEIYNKLVTKIKPDFIAITEDDPIRDKKLIQSKSVGAKLKIIRKYKPHSTSKILSVFDL